MISNGVLRSSNLFLQEILTFECFMSIAHTTAYYCTAITLLYLNCVRDFCEIFIFTTLKITERAIWTLEVAGLAQNHKKYENVFSFRDIGTQMDIRNTEQPVSISTVNNVKKSLFNTHLNSKDPLYQNCEREVRLTSPQRNILSTCSYNSVMEEIDGPAVLMLSNDKATATDETSPLQSTSQSPVCRIHMTPCPKNLRTKYSKVKVDLSPEERSCLKRKWQKWSLRNNGKKQCLIMQPLFSSNPEEYTSEEKSPKKAKMNAGKCDYNRNETMLDKDSPEMGMNSCYKNVMSRLKSKFMRRDSEIAIYKTF